MESKECDKRNIHISSKLHIIYIYFFFSNNGSHRVTKTFSLLHFTQLHFTPPHYTCRHFTSSLHFTVHPTTIHSTSLHFSTLHFSFTPHPITLHSTSLHSSTLHFLSFKLHTITLLLIETSCAVATVPSQLYCVPTTRDN